MGKREVLVGENMLSWSLHGKRRLPRPEHCLMVVGMTSEVIISEIEDSGERAAGQGSPQA